MSSDAPSHQPAHQPGHPPGHAPAPVTDPRRLRMILVAMITALVAVIASVSGLNVATQDLAADLGASQSTLLWIINGYTLALASLLLPIGALGDRWGRKPILLGGLALFAVANLAATMATTSSFLLVSRVVAGVGAAMIMPVTLSVITSSFPAEQRARAIGIWSGFAGAGGILGLFVSSYLIDNFTWPWLFTMPIVFALVAIVLTMRFVDNSSEQHTGRFDTVGSVLSALAIGGLVLGIHEGPVHGWTTPITVAGLVVGVLALIGFVAWELRQSAPLLQVRLFANRNLTAGSITLFAIFAVMFGLFLVLVQFLQIVLGYSALRASAGLLPMAAAMMPLSTVAAVLAQRVGTRRVLMAGAGLFSAGLALLAMFATADNGYLGVLPGLIVAGLGMGLAMTPSTTAITESLPADQQGVASALNDTVRELGGAIGVALLGSALNAGYRSSVSSATTGLAPDLADTVQDGFGSAVSVAPQLGADAPRILEAARVAFVDGWQSAMWIGAVTAAATLVFLIVRGPTSGGQRMTNQASPGTNADSTAAKSDAANDTQPDVGLDAPAAEYV